MNFEKNNSFKPLPRIESVLVICPHFIVKPNGEWPSKLVKPVKRSDIHGTEDDKVFVTVIFILFNRHDHEIETQNNAEPVKELNVKFLMNNAVLVLEVLLELPALADPGHALDICDCNYMRMSVRLESEIVEVITNWDEDSLT